jgi:hypothetical protein
LDVLKQTFLASSNFSSYYLKLDTVISDTVIGYAKEIYLNVISKFILDEV